MAKKRLVVVCVGLVVLSIIAILILPPAITVFSVYDGMKKTNLSLEDYGTSVKELEGKMTAYQSDISACNQMKDQIMDDFMNFSVAYADCSAGLSSVELRFNYTVSSLEQANREITVLEKKVSETEEKAKLELEQSMLEYGLLAANTAKNLCCKARVDNPSVDSYEVVENHVICMANGRQKVVC